jgi:hypothetical protein
MKHVSVNILVSITYRENSECHYNGTLGGASFIRAALAPATRMPLFSSRSQTAQEGTNMGSKA